jgi:hypothetical protein
MVTIVPDRQPAATATRDGRIKSRQERERQKALSWVREDSLPEMIVIIVVALVIVVGLLIALVGKR